MFGCNKSTGKSASSRNPESCSSILFDAGVDVKSAQKFLGHSDIEVTLEIYTHLSKFKEEKAIQALDEHLKERKKEPEIRLLRAL